MNINVRRHSPNRPQQPKRSRKGVFASARNMFNLAYCNPPLVSAEAFILRPVIYDGCRIRWHPQQLPPTAFNLNMVWHHTNILINLQIRHIPSEPSPSRSMWKQTQVDFRPSRPRQKTTYSPVPTRSLQVLRLKPSWSPAREILALISYNSYNGGPGARRQVCP